MEKGFSPTFYVPRNAISDIMDSQRGKIFTVEFTKKNGEHRVMNCRKGVHSYLKGGTNLWLESGKYPNLKVVFDMKKKEYRSVNLDTVSCMKANKKVFRFLDL